MNAFEMWIKGMRMDINLLRTESVFKAGMTAARDAARTYGKTFYDNGDLTSATLIMNVIALIEKERDGE